MLPLCCLAWVSNAKSSLSAASAAAAAAAAVGVDLLEALARQVTTRRGIHTTL
jgi:hypothetical protein